MVAFRLEMEGQPPNPALHAELCFGSFHRVYLPGALTQKKSAQEFGFFLQAWDAAQLNFDMLPEEPLLCTF